MKIDIKYIYLLFIIITAFFSITLATPRSDNYYAYYVSRELLRNPDFLWNYIDEIRAPIVAQPSVTSGITSRIFHYNPLTMLAYAFFIFLSIPPIILVIISFLFIVFFTYKMNNRAVPLLFISFLFLRCVIQGEGDVFTAALALLSVYFFDKNPLVSGIFAGLTFLSKQTGILVLGWFVLSVILFKRDKIKLNFKNGYLSALLVIIIFTLIWSARNFILYQGDLLATFTGVDYNQFKEAQKTMVQGAQQNSPEINIIDLTGYYPNPIDLLLVSGMIFLIVDIYKKRKIDYINFFVLISLAAYITAQLLHIGSLMTIRYYLFAFPLFAVIIADNLKEKYLKYILVVSIAFFIFYTLSLQKYAYNQLKDSIDKICPEIKNTVDMKPVFVDFFHHLLVAYECDLNLTDFNHSDYVVNLTSGSIYLTNKT